MGDKLTYILEEIRNKGIHLSYQRVKVLEYLTHNPDHPTAEQIYTGLINEIPTLSKTTVYNTLNALSKSGMVKEIPIEHGETRYDINTEVHGHFKCDVCRRVYDFEVNIDSLEVKDLEGFIINDKSLYFKGTCSRCLKNIKTNNKGDCKHGRN